MSLGSKPKSKWAFVIQPLCLKANKVKRANSCALGIIKRFSTENHFWDGFLRKLINKRIGKNTGIKNEIKIGASIVIALWWRTLKTLASTELLIVHLLCTILLMAGCLKRNPTGETSFYPEKSEVIWRLQSRNGWEGTPKVLSKVHGEKSCTDKTLQTFASE